MARIMVVEDDDELASEISNMLTMLGYQVAGTAASGEDCLKFVNQAQPDLVLMDIKIRGNLDGIQTAERLKKIKDVPVVYLTGFSDSTTLKRARQTHAHGFLVKPFRVSEIKSTIEMALFKHHTEMELRRRENWFSTMLQAIGDAVISVDTEQTVVFVNQVAEKLMETGGGSLVGTQLANVFHLLHRHTREPLDLVERVLRNREPVWLPTGAILARARGDLPVESSVAPIVDGEGKLLGAVLVFRDTREREALLEQIAASDRLASLGTLAAGVAHEINNPLTYVMANAVMVGRELGRIEKELHLAPSPERLLQSAATLGRLRDELTEIEDGAERIKRIVTDLRVFGRPETGQSSGDLISALHWALRVTRTLFTGRAELELDLAPVPNVSGDMTRVGQVFINLLANAAQAIPEGDSENQRVYVSTSRVGTDRVLVEIRDTGIGMPPEVLRRIFEPFYTTKPVGTGMGLGLSVCSGIVSAVGGELTVDSTPGQGSTFRVYLAVAPARTAEPSAAKADSPTPRGRILVIDDDEIVAKSIARMLCGKHDVTVLTDGRSALPVLLAGGYDVAVCDLLMPHLNGKELYDEVLSQQPELARRFVFLSGAFTAEASSFLERVPNPRLPKPPSMAELERCVHSILVPNAHRSGCHAIAKRLLQASGNE